MTLRRRFRKFTFWLVPDVIAIAWWTFVLKAVRALEWLLDRDIHHADHS